ncbi:hypothetical protein ILYODFUR_009583 [Ilyodon furcidens]|uniref:Uncharacterized protein n=1 Tax=Ilyodon furcidens TaxID=33524 RepID=A0ABV0UF69_9TELE
MNLCPSLKSLAASKPYHTLHHFKNCAGLDVTLCELASMNNVWTASLGFNTNYWSRTMKRWRRGKADSGKSDHGWTEEDKNQTSAGAAVTIHNFLTLFNIYICHLWS